MRTLGFYVTCDDALCAPCFERAGGEAGWNERGGFEGWPEPLAIFEDTEADSPTHCSECGRLIEHDLTDAGLAAVAESIGDCFQAGEQNPVTLLWARHYEQALDDATMPQADGVKLADACALLELLPRDMGWAEIEHCRKYAVQAGWIEQEAT